ncbi:hypothetical protein CBR_g60019 [Chara braunii]|uniref:Uncharacterized protein n=1 Tax=Chara braunii TaxID=69332 RepID=A0A388K8J3_CHABU|nr:hypothetical protein CBR_g60019 [Chara braunii]|eukprot:GBG66368.1 hypothetical protein CBR_g60019 [Chara braunii]
MGERLEKRLDELGIDKGKMVDTGGGQTSTDEALRLRMENEDLKRKLSEALGPSGEDRVHYLQNEVMLLRKQVGERHVNEDVIVALKAEICELKQTALVKTNFEQEIAGLRKEVNLLRDQNERVTVEAGLWKDQALLPGNKRGSVVLQTPKCSNRGSPKPRWTDNVRDDDKWKADYKKLQSLHRLANIEADALKEKRAEEEARRAEAKKQVKALEEKMERLMTSGGLGNDKQVGETNLKERLEKVALRCTRKGVKGSPRRTGGKSVPKTAQKEKEPTPRPMAANINDRAKFVEEQKHQLRMLRKIGLEPLCKEEGVKMGKFEDTVCDLAEARAKKTFGEGSGTMSKSDRKAVEVSDNTSNNVGDSEDESGKSVELSDPFLSASLL